MPVRGIRGATTADANTPEAITQATAELLAELVRLNGLDATEIAFCELTTTTDLDAEYPALAARRMGWLDVPLLCGNDQVVAGPHPRAIERCIRVLILYNTDRGQNAMRHAYLRGAQAIKADLDSTRREIQGETV